MKYRDLIELYNSNRASNILIYNTGGFGKTTQMKNLNKYLLEHLDQYKTIPLYIDAKALDKADEKPVLKYVAKIFCGMDITNTDEVEMFFEKRTGVYTYSFLFLIDAINEADDAVIGKIVTDIRRLKEIQEIHFIVSSRINEGYSVFNDFHKYEFCELTDTQIETYLSRKFSKSGIEVEKFNKSLVDILKIPMYLSVFSYAYKDETFPELYGEKTVRKADLLLAYLYKVAEESRMDKNLATSLEREIQFTIEHYLPALAFKMCCQSKVSLNNEEYKEIKKELNTEYFLSFFDEEESEELYPLLSQTARLNYEFPRIARERLALWCKNGDDYAFSHQNWLQFFTARHIVNLMNAQKFDELEYTMRKEVRRFAGELICEYDEKLKYSKSNHADATRRCECDFESKTDTNSKMSPIEEFMQKNYIKLNESPQSIANFIEIMKIARNNNISAKYDSLNLKNVSFAGCMLDSSTFNRTYIYKNNFLSEGHKGSVTAIAVTTNGKYIVSGGEDGTIRIWDIETKMQIGEAIRAHKFGITSIAVSSDTKFIVSGSRIPSSANQYTYNEHILGGGIGIWDFKTHKLIKHFSNGTKSISITADNKYIVSNRYNYLDIYNVKKLSLQNIIRLDENEKMGGLYKNDIYIVDEHLCEIKVWNITTLKTTAKTIMCYDRDPISSPTISIAFSVNGEYLVIGKRDGTIKILDVENKKQIGRQLKVLNNAIHVLTISNDNKYIFIGGEDGTIIIWNREKRGPEGCPLIGHRSAVTSISMTKDGKYIVSGSTDETIRVWDFEQRKQLTPVLSRGIDRFFCIDSSNKNFYILAGSEGFIYKLDNQGVISWKIRAHSKQINSVSISKNDAFFVTASDDYNISIWNTNSGSKICDSLIGHRGFIYTAIISDDLKYVISASRDNTLRIWNIESGTEIKRYVIDGNCLYVKLSHNGKYIVTIKRDSFSLYNINLDDNCLFYVKKMFSDKIRFDIRSVYLSNDGTIAFGDPSGIVRVWDPTSHEKIKEIKVCSQPIMSILFLDKNKMCCTSISGSVIIVDNNQILKIGDHHNCVTAIATTSRDNIVSAGFDGQIHIWNIMNKTQRICQCISPLIRNCYFKDTIYEGDLKNELFYMLYYNGAIVPEEFIPKPIPFETDDD